MQKGDCSHGAKGRPLELKQNKEALPVLGEVDGSVQMILFVHTRRKSTRYLTTTH